MLLIWLALRLVVLAAIIDLAAHIVPGIHVHAGLLLPLGRRARHRGEPAAASDRA